MLATTERLASRCLVKKMDFNNENRDLSVADPGKGSGDSPPPPLFLDQTEARMAENIFWRPPPPPPLCQGLLSLLIDLKTSTTTSTRFSQNRELAREQASVILAGKRYSLRHSTTSLSENVVVTEIGQYQILEGLPVSAIGKGLNLLQ